jgi:hypothetical protein
MEKKTRNELISALANAHSELDWCVFWKDWQRAEKLLADLKKANEEIMATEYTVESLTKIK